MFKNKSLIIVAVIIIIALLGGVAYLSLSTSSKTTTPAEKITVIEPKESSPSSITGSLKSLLTGGKTISCAITYPNNGGSGTFYISDKKFRGDFTTKIEGGREVTNQVVSDGVYTYIWSSESSTGIKMKIDITSPTANALTGNFNLDQEVGMNCSPWGIDTSKFTIPTNIQFTDMSNLIPKTSALPSAKTGPPVLNESVCDQITDPAGKAACLKTISGQ